MSGDTDDRSVDRAEEGPESELPEIRPHGMLGAALDAAVNGIIVTDRRGTIAWANRAMTTLTGYERSELIGSNPRLFKSGEQTEEFYRSLWSTIAAGDVWHGDIVNRRKDGSRYVEHMTITPVPHGAARVSWFVAVKLDVTQQRQMREALERSEAWWRAILEHSSDLVGVLDAGGTIAYASPSVRRILGFEPHALIGAAALRLVHRRDRRRVLDHLEAVVRDARPPGPLQFRAQHASGGWRTLEATSTNALHEHAVQGIIVNAHDVTEHRVHEQRVARFRAFRERLRRLADESLETSLDPSFLGRILTYAIEGVPGAQAGSLLLRNAHGRFQFAAVEGYSQDLLALELPARAVADRLADDAPVVLEGHGPAIDLDPYTRELLYEGAGRAGQILAAMKIPIRIDGDLRGVLNLDNFDARDAFDEDAVQMATLFGRQVGGSLRRFDLEDVLQLQSTIDSLTRLPNRARGEELLSRCLEEIRTAPHGGAFLLVDVDNLKVINDAYGHGIGDAVVRQTAERLRDVCPAQSVLARWTGDEFMVVLPVVHGRGIAEGVAREIVAAFDRPLRVSGVHPRTTVSVGLVPLPTYGASLEEAIQNGHIALRHAKRQGGSSHATITPTMGAAVARRVHIETALQTALEDGSVAVHFQPRVNLLTGRVCGYEALARWSDPKLGAVSPDEFVPIAEESGAIETLGEKVLRDACRAARLLLDNGDQASVSVNLSIRQLQDRSLVDRVRRALGDSGLRPAQLELEITESAAMTDIARTVEILRALRAVGVSIAVDDFGTAYSSLAYLKVLPIQAIKIDRSFVMDIADDPADSPNEASIVQAIIALGKSLDLRVVAEGVETPSQRALLRLMGCDEAQGFLFGAAEPMRRHA